ncbi:DUF6238 family protein [Kitasatospora indigofera]|uniref:DUF6238 family protein n=1 Tax=Kitasatospora indigofera TaxID=67307 RepID=UPI003639E4A6
MPHDLPDLLRFASAAVDVHHHTLLPDDEPLSRAALDSLHGHTVALYGLLDTATVRTRAHAVAVAESDQLHTARVRLWQVCDHLHNAYHCAAHADGRMPTREACAARLPEGAPELTICQRHAATAARLRQITTPTDLHAPVTGLIRR